MKDIEARDRSEAQPQKRSDGGVGIQKKQPVCYLDTCYLVAIIDKEDDFGKGHANII